MLGISFSSLISYIELIITYAVDFFYLEYFKVFISIQIQRNEKAYLNVNLPFYYFLPHCAK